MIKTRCIQFILIGLIFSLITNAQNPKEKGLESITKQAIQGQLEFLSSDWTEGRQTGTEGAYMAADYIASMFKVFGLQPGGDMEWTKVSRYDRRTGKKPKQYRDYYQKFSLIEYSMGDKQELSISHRTNTGYHTYNLDYKTDFYVRTSDVSVKIEAPVVFVGYGYKNDKVGYNDYKGIDAKGKIVVCLFGYPGKNDTNSFAFKKIGKVKHRDLERGKMEAAKNAGALAIVEYHPRVDVTKWWAENIPFRYNGNHYEGDTPRKSSFYATRMSLNPGKISNRLTKINLSQRAFNNLIKNTKINIEQFEKQAENSLKPASTEIKNLELKLTSNVNTRTIQARNVIGLIPGVDTTEIIVIGGHYDHLGKHDGWIWNGADDNASGTVGVMTIAKAFMQSGQKPQKTIVFAAWTAEEKGLHGSNYFVNNPYNKAKVILNLNYDMISRNHKKDTLGLECKVKYSSKYEVLKNTSMRNNNQYDLGLKINYQASVRPAGGSDHFSFSKKNIPVMSFMAGFPPEYHQPNDEIDRVDFDKMMKIIKLGYLNIWDLANTEW